MFKILIVDDDDDFQELSRITVRRSGLPVKMMEATNGQQALDLLSSGSFTPDLVLLDINMPRMGGYEFLEAYSSHIEAKCPVVMLTGSDCAAERYKAMAYPFVKEFFEKPLSVDNIIELTELVDQLS
ncbi:MAG: response regulator [Fuerstiella sp.]